MYGAYNVFLASVNGRPTTSCFAPPSAECVIWFEEVPEGSGFRAISELPTAQRRRRFHGHGHNDHSYLALRCQTTRQPLSNEVGRCFIDSSMDAIEPCYGTVPRFLHPDNSSQQLSNCLEQGEISICNQQSCSFAITHRWVNPCLNTQEMGILSFRSLHQLLNSKLHQSPSGAHTPKLKMTQMKSGMKIDEMDEAFITPYDQTAPGVRHFVAKLRSQQMVLQKSN